MSRPKTPPPPPVTEQELRDAIDAAWAATPHQEDPTPQARAGDADTLRHIRDWLSQIKEYEA
jgi:hypothetical protein